LQRACIAQSVARSSFQAAGWTPWPRKSPIFSKCTSQILTRALRFESVLLLSPVLITCAAQYERDPAASKATWTESRVLATRIGSSMIMINPCSESAGRLRCAARAQLFRPCLYAVHADGATRCTHRVTAVLQLLAAASPQSVPAAASAHKIDLESRLQGSQVKLPCLLHSEQPVAVRIIRRSR
jgi:hypothetical protein